MTDILTCCFFVTSPNSRFVFQILRLTREIQIVSIKSYIHRPGRDKTLICCEKNIMASILKDMWWVPDDAEVWTLAAQSSAEQPNGCINFLVQKNQKMVAHQREKCLPATNLLNTPEDLVFLHDVNQATILSCTRSRFNNHKIYTNMGQVLMSVNPFEKIPGLYGNNVIEEFKNPDSKNMAAHVYSIPSRAYANMCRTGGNQSILISGESGAGMTTFANFLSMSLSNSIILCANRQD